MNIPVTILGGRLRNIPEVTEALAEYFTRFVIAYANEVGFS